MNPLAVKMLENYLEIKPIISSEPQVIGAYGAAILALKKLNSLEKYEEN